MFINGVTQRVIDSVTLPGVKILPPNYGGDIQYTPGITNPFQFEVYTYTVPTEIEQMTDLIKGELFSIESINVMGSWIKTLMNFIFTVHGGIGVMIAFVLLYFFLKLLFRATEEYVMERKVFIAETFAEEKEAEQTQQTPLDPADQFQQEIDAYSRLF